jgi:hypothetical protein
LEPFLLIAILFKTKCGSRLYLCDDVGGSEHDMILLSFLVDVKGLFVYFF